MASQSPLLFPNPVSQSHRPTVQLLGAGAGAEGTPGAPPAARAPHALGSVAGYAEPLRSVPPEKFNHTAIPKGYRCPWQEFVGYRDYSSESRSHTPSLGDYRNFNK